MKKSTRKIQLLDSFPDLSTTKKSKPKAPKVHSSSFLLTFDDPDLTILKRSSRRSTISNTTSFPPQSSLQEKSRPVGRPPSRRNSISIKTPSSTENIPLIKKSSTLGRSRLNKNTLSEKNINSPKTKTLPLKKNTSVLGRPRLKKNISPENIPSSSKVSSKKISNSFLEKSFSNINDDSSLQNPNSHAFKNTNSVRPKYSRFSFASSDPSLAFNIPLVQISPPSDIPSLKRKRDSLSNSFISTNENSSTFKNPSRVLPLKSLKNQPSRLASVKRKSNSYNYLSEDSDFFSRPRSKLPLSDSSPSVKSKKRKTTESTNKKSVKCNISLCYFIPLLKSCAYYTFFCLLILSKASGKLHEIERRNRDFAAKVLAIQPQINDESGSQSSDDNQYGAVLDPGELILAKKNTFYYPAMIISLLKRNVYKLKLYDGSTLVSPRDGFYTIYEPGFSSCKIEDTFLNSLRSPQPLSNNLQNILSEDSSMSKFRLHLESAFKDKLDHLWGLEKISDFDFTLFSKQFDNACSTNIKTKLSSFYRGNRLERRRLYVFDRGSLTYDQFDYITILLREWYPNPPLMWSLEKKNSDSTNSNFISKVKPLKKEKDGFYCDSESDTSTDSEDSAVDSPVDRKENGSDSQNDFSVHVLSLGIQD
ncbi:hypothetical protein AYI68_g5681 [Smittium mucronatum]|uniref:Uncharacterized protein n=1 Tax=Smittium mucronatum TaxID=133383 RepID=A0A1R0GTL9_9FUNG|nr:hypothetical protein AYI68_g5681 [Smittium mucronatum]